MKTVQIQFDARSGASSWVPNKAVQRDMAIGPGIGIGPNGGDGNADAIQQEGAPMEQ
jgi:hypothetical protein